MTDFNDWYAKTTAAGNPFSKSNLRDWCRIAYEAGAASQAGTLRDEFAGRALASFTVDNFVSAEALGILAYRISDAMLEARKTTGEGEA
jgi:hypothetical protein